MKAFKWFAHPFKKNLHLFNALAKTFEWFAYLFNKICIRLTPLVKRLSGLLICLKKFASV